MTPQTRLRPSDQMNFSSKIFPVGLIKGVLSSGDVIADEKILHHNRMKSA
jgi:hypothetical protein